MLLAWAALGPAMAWGATRIEGLVYQDSNGNHRRDPGEPGLPGVLVSDGSRVAKTGAEGRYELESADARMLLWITVPRDHAAPAGFWRWTDGSRAEDFPLTRRVQPNEFLFVQITDAHVGRVDRVQELAERLNKFPKPLAFVVNTGDLVGGADTVLPDKARQQYDNYLSAVKPLKVPLWNLPGNHEHVAFHLKEADRSDPRYGKGMYRELLGPMHYSFDWGPVHFIALDGTTLPYKEKLGPEQLAWLAADLRLQPAEKPLVLFCHQSIPDLVDAAELEQLLHGRHVLAAFCGHLHSTFRVAWAGTTVYFTGALSGSWWSAANPDGTPQGFRLVQVAEDGLKTEYFNREGRDAVAVVEPLASSVISGRMEFKAAVLDFGKPVELAARFEGRRTGIELDHREALWSTWKGSLDTRQVFDGPRVLKVASQLGNEMSWAEIRYLVVNGRPEPFHSDSPAVLKLQVRGINAADEVLLNGKALATIPATTPSNSTLQFPVPAERLAKVNRVTIRAVVQRGQDLDDFSVGPIWLEYKGKPLYDLRYPSFERHLIGDAPTRRYRPEREIYFCLP
jgi:hypothetical protein